MSENDRSMDTSEARTLTDQPGALIPAAMADGVLSREEAQRIALAAAALAAEVADVAACAEAV